MNKKHCLIITRSVSNVKRLADWLHDWAYELYYGEREHEIIERAQAQSHDFIFLYPTQRQLHLIKQFKVIHSFALISASKDCFTAYLDEKVSIHIKDPFRPSQYLKLEKQLCSNNKRLLADCMFVKSHWHYYRIPLDEIYFLERDNVPGYTRIQYDNKSILVFGILTAWERALHCMAKFERIGDNLLVAKKHQHHIINDYLMINNHRIKVVRWYIETDAYRETKWKFPVIDMHLQGVATQPVIT